MSREPIWLNKVSRFFTGPSFPAFALSLLFFHQLALLALLFVPPAETGFGAFAEEFRTWCFGYDPATGSVNGAYAALMVTPPLLVAIPILWLWWTPLRALRARPRALARPLIMAALIVGAGTTAVALFGPKPARGELPFPAEVLRTAHKPPPLRLVNQAGETVDLSGLRGKVVLLTGVYASCPHTCPRILAEAKRVIAGLTPEEKRDLRVVAVTIDPANDSPGVLADLAGMHGMKAPLYNLVTGDVADVERTLDFLGVSRKRDPETGVIDHSNLFVLVDRRGKIAYRFTLGPRQERWLSTALRILLLEPPDAG